VSKPSDRARRVHLALVLSCALLVGCSSGVNRPVREVTARTGSDGVQRVKLVTHSFWFEPNRIVVKANAPVEIHLHNGSWIVPHGFACMSKEAGLDLHEHVGMLRRSKTIRFTPTTPGDYPFFCPVHDHAHRGMKGTLVVQP